MARDAAPAASVPLRRPDRGAPAAKTLLDLADERRLSQRAAAARRPPSHLVSPAADRLLDAALWTLSLAVVYLTFDVLVHHQYATRVRWPALAARAARAWLGASAPHPRLRVVVTMPKMPTMPMTLTKTMMLIRAAVFFLLFYILHPHDASPVLVASLGPRRQRPLRQAVFFAMSAASGCYLIHLSNAYGYLATMKQAPPLGCLWLWAVVELDLPLAVASLAVAGLFLWQGGYDIK